MAKADLTALCRNVSQWIALQADEASSLFGHAEQAHQALMDRLDKAERQIRNGLGLLPQFQLTSISSSQQGACIENISATNIVAIHEQTKKVGFVSGFISGDIESFPAIEALLARGRRRLTRVKPISSQLPKRFPIHSIESNEETDRATPARVPESALRLLLIRDSFHHMLAWLRELHSKSLDDSIRLSHRATTFRRELLLSFLRHAIRRWLSLRQDMTTLRRSSNRLSQLRGWWRWHSYLKLQLSVTTCHLNLRIGLRRWSARALLLQARSWRMQQCVSALGGPHRQHLRCMRSFDPRGIFVEEGSAVMADAYRCRRILAVHLCRWTATVFGVVTAKQSTKE